MKLERCQRLINAVAALSLAAFSSGASAVYPSGMHVLRAGPGIHECNSLFDRCLITVYVIPPFVSPDADPASPRCSSWVEHGTTRAGGNIDRVVWVIVEAMSSDTAKYRFMPVRNAIALDDESAFDVPDVEDGATRRRFKWKLRKNHPGQTTYRIQVEASTDGGKTYRPCDANDPIIVNES